MKIISLVITLFLGITLFGQNVSNSPYSRFGLGEMQSSSTATYSAMGGVGIGINNPLTVNFYNPASYSSFYTQRFVMQTGIAHTTNFMQTSEIDQVVNATKFNYLVFGFPITKWWGTSFGLLPYSEVSYSFSDRNNVQAADYVFDGNGGVNRVYFGNGFNLSKNLSLGVNAEYLFGSLNSYRKVQFDDNSILNAKSIEENYLLGLHLNFGAIYTAKISDFDFNLGYVYDMGSVISAERSNLIETYRLGTVSELIEDTILYNNIEGDLVLPTAHSVGASISNDQWLLAAEYKLKNWSEYRLFSETDSLKNSSKIAFGAEYTPDKKSINNYFKLIRYRVGLHATSTNLNLRNQQLNEVAITLGFGLPLRKSGALFNISAEIGRRGTTAENLIQDTFARFKFGLVLSDVWFIKRKYD